MDFWQDSLESLEEEMLTKEKMISLKTFFDQESFNDVYKIGEQLIKAEVMSVEGSFEAVAQNIGGFHNYLSKQNIPFMYVQLPNKLSNTKVNLYKNLVDEQNPIATCLVNELRNRNISCYDFREVMKEEGLDSFEYFYKTSYHWNAELAFMAAEGILKELESLSILALDKSKLGLENYNKLTYEQKFLGPYGKITGILYGGLDDFELIVPKYETSYSWIAEDKVFFANGNAVDALFNSIFLGWDYYGQHSYGANPLEVFKKHKIVNQKNKNGKKVVWIFDCFTKAIAHILAPHFSEMYRIKNRLLAKKREVCYP